jgi:hypothetical protein
MAKYTVIYARFPADSDIKDRIQKATDLLNKSRPGANYSENSFAKAAIEKYISEIENLLK